MASMPACAASELVAKGRESAVLLKAMLGQLPDAVVGAGATTPHDLRDLAEQILRCCDRALAALHRGTGTGESDTSSSRKRKPELEGGLADAAPAPTGSSKRMRMSRGERGTGVEKKGTMEDGFIWRKYGQKDIHGSNYPRLYFRCTYKDDRGCKARRRVQQSDTDPGVYLITYFDEHTCCGNHAVEPPLPEPFVINFGLSSASSDDQQPSGSPWPSSCDDNDGPVETHTPSAALCSSPEEELQAGTSCNVADEFIDEQSTPLPELMNMMTLPEWEWDPMDGCLDWEFGKGETFDTDGFVRYDFDYIDLL